RRRGRRCAIQDGAGRGRSGPQRGRRTTATEAGQRGGAASGLAVLSRGGRRLEALGVHLAVERQRVELAFRLLLRGGLFDRSRRGGGSLTLAGRMAGRSKLRRAGRRGRVVDRGGRLMRQQARRLEGV